MNHRYSLCLIGFTLIGLLIFCGLLVAPAGTALASSPHIVASYQHNVIEFKEFEPNTDLMFEIRDSTNTTSLYSDTLKTDGGGSARFSAYWTFDIQPGYQVFASDGNSEKRLTVENVRYDILDLEANQARGTAPQGARVVVYVHGWNEYREVETYAGPGGAWSADLGDIDAYLSSKAWVFDADGDASEAWVPNLEVWNVYGRFIEGQSFTSGGLLSLEIYSQDGALLFGLSDVEVENDHGRIHVELEQHGQELVPGTLISVTDQVSGESRQLTVEPLTMELFDYEQELVEGTAEDGATVSVSAHTDEGYYEVVTQADSGVWLADFASQGADLNPSDDVYARLLDPDSDATRTGMLSIMASTTEDFIHWSWHISPVTATIKDPGGATVFGPQTFEDMYEMGINTPDYGIDLQPNYFIEVDYGNGRVVDLTMADLSVTGLDREADLAEGTAPPNTTVSVRVWDTEYPYFAGIAILSTMDVWVGEDGSWQADFSDHFDIDIGHSAVVMLGEFDGGVSAAALPNSAPVIYAIQGPAEPVAINTAIDFSASFSDDDPDDAHTAVWNWGDGTTSAGEVDEAVGTITGIHTYETVGVYVPQLTVCDEFNACTSSAYSYVVIIDIEGSFVSGGGWIDSPAGAYVADPDLTGMASFGFVAKYKKGAAVPDGNTEFQFRAAQLNFLSSSYNWLLVTDDKVAWFRGTGTVNGESGYIFLIWAGDGHPDTFRIVIREADGPVIYHNGNQPISGGSIIMHGK